MEIWGFRLVVSFIGTIGTAGTIGTVGTVGTSREKAFEPLTEIFAGATAFTFSA